MLLFLEWIDAIDPIDAIDAIADKGFWGCGLVGMEENKKSALPKQPCTYSTQGCIVFVDQWGNLPFGCFP